MDPMPGLITPRIPQRLLLALATAGILAGCGPRQPAASTNEVFTSRQTYGSEGPKLVKRNPALDGELATRVLNWQERAQVWETFSAMASGSVSQLKPARYGLRFDDVPRAVRNAVQQVEMALINTTHDLPRLEIDYRDREGSPATLLVTLEPRGPLANVKYVTPSEDDRLLRAQIRANATRAFARLRMPSPGLVRQVAIGVVEGEGGEVLDCREIPEQYTFRILMLDGQPAKLEVVRMPPPTIAKWEAWAGVFPDKKTAERLGEAFARELSAWGRVPEMPTRPAILDESATE